MTALSWLAIVLLIVVLPVLGGLAGLVGQVAPAAGQAISASGACPSALVLGLNPGAQCYRTDTRSYFMWDGTQWIPVATLSTSAAGGAQATDYQLTLSAVDVCSSDNTNLVKTRLATGDWALARTAAGAETYNVECDLSLAIRTTTGRGVQVTGVSIAYFVGTVALTSHTFQALSTTTYANNAANAVAGYGGAVTCALATATQANPYLTACSIPTPAFVNTAATHLVIDWQAVLANTGVYRVHAIVVSYTVVPL